MKRQIFLIGLMVDERLESSVVRNYITRAVKHYHREADDQGSFHGVRDPERIAVIEIEKAEESLTNLKELVDFFKVMDRMQK